MKDSTQQGAEMTSIIVSALRETKNVEIGPVGDEEDVFSKFGFDSMQTFGVLVNLEKKLGIMIGEDDAEFDRVRTFGGLKKLLTEKVVSTKPSPERQALAGG